MITSLKIAKLTHLAALKISAAKSVIGIGVLMASTATGIVVTEQVEPDYVDAAVSLISKAVDTETGLSAQEVVGGSALPTLAAENHNASAGHSTAGSPFH